MYKRILILFIFALHIASSENQTKTSKIKYPKKLFVPKFIDDCKKIKCPTKEDPVCVKIKYNKRELANTTAYIIMLNKCEMEYTKCHQGIEAIVVPMKYCRHDNISNAGKRRFKRAIEANLPRVSTSSSSSTEDNDSLGSDSSLRAERVTRARRLRSGVPKKLKKTTSKTAKKVKPKKVQTKTRQGEESHENEEDIQSQNDNGAIDNGGSKQDNNDGDEVNDPQTHENEVNEMDDDNNQAEEPAEEVEENPSPEEPGTEQHVSEHDEAVAESKPQEFAGDETGSPGEDNNVKDPLDVNDDTAEKPNEEENEAESKPQEFAGEETGSPVEDNDVKAPLNVNDDTPEKPNEEENEETNNDHEAACPTQCPARDVMVCAKCQHGIYRTFSSICHMRMYTCEHPDDGLELMSRYPCILSAPYLATENMIPNGTLSEPNDEDKILKFIMCRQRTKDTKADTHSGNGGIPRIPLDCGVNKRLKYYYKGPRKEVWPALSDYQSD